MTTTYLCYLPRFNETLAKGAVPCHAGSAAEAAEIAAEAFNNDNPYEEGAYWPLTVAVAQQGEPEQRFLVALDWEPTFAASPLGA